MLKKILNFFPINNSVKCADDILSPDTLKEEESN